MLEAQLSSLSKQMWKNKGKNNLYKVKESR